MIAEIRRWLARWWPEQESDPAWRRAADLVRAIDAGGMPLNPAKVNDIARQLGLEVSSRASVEHTIARIRAALEYHRTHRNGS